MFHAWSRSNQIREIHLAAEMAEQARIAAELAEKKQLEEEKAAAILEAKLVRAINIVLFATDLTSMKKYACDCSRMSIVKRTLHDRLVK